MGELIIIQKLLTLTLCGCAFALGHKIFNTGNKKIKLATSEFKGKSELNNLRGSNGIQVSKNIQLSEVACYEGICMIAPTGSGKTSTVPMPNLLQNDLPESSIVAIDIKGELYRKTAWYQKNVCKRNVILFNPLKPMNSFKYNPLGMCVDDEGKPDITQVRQLAQAILLNGNLALSDETSHGSNEWVMMATPLVTAAMLYVMQHKTMNNITSALNVIIDNTTEELDILFSSNSKDIKRQWNIFKSSMDSKNTLGSIKITLATSLQIFTDPKIEATTHHSEFNFKDLRKTPTIIYISFEQQDARYLSPFLGILYTQMFQKLLNVDDKYIPVFMFMDEFNNSGRIAGFDNICATARAKRLSLMVILQDITGLYKNYGMESGKTILNNLKTKLVLDSLSDIDTMKYISDLCGPTEIKVQTRTETENKTTYSYSTQTRPLIDYSEVRRIDNEMILVITANRQPVLDKKNKYFESQIYLSNIRETALPIM